MLSMLNLLSMKSNLISIFWCYIWLIKRLFRLMLFFEIKFILLYLVWFFDLKFCKLYFDKGFKMYIY